MIALILLVGCAAEDLGHEYTEPIDILDGDGQVQARGWARQPLFGFDRDAIPAAQADGLREWDFYAVYGPDFAVNVTLAEIRLNGSPLILGGFQVHDVAADAVLGPSLIGLGGDALAFEPDPDGVYDVSLAGGDLHYGMDGDVRTIAFESGADHAALRVGPRHTESMALVTPFFEDGEFFYEDKIVALPATGSIDLGGRHWDVPEGSLAVLDFARGVMPSHVTWDWAHGVGVIDGHTVGLNLGSVYGDEAGGTPNAVVVDGVLHKLGRVEQAWDPGDVAAPWTFTSDDGRVDLTLVSGGHTEVTDVDLGSYRARLWKLYGRFEGTVRLDDGTALAIEGLAGAAEHLETDW